MYICSSGLGGLSLICIMCLDKYLCVVNLQGLFLKCSILAAYV